MPVRAPEYSGSKNERFGVRFGVRKGRCLGLNRFKQTARYNMRNFVTNSRQPATTKNKNISDL